MDANPFHGCSQCHLKISQYGFVDSCRNCSTWGSVDNPTSYQTSMVTDNRNDVTNPNVIGVSHGQYS